MFQKILDYLFVHKSAILATVVALQNGKVLHGTASTLGSVVVALFGG